MRFGLFPRLCHTTKGFPQISMPFTLFGRAPVLIHIRDHLFAHIQQLAADLFHLPNVHVLNNILVLVKFERASWGRKGHLLQRGKKGLGVLDFSPDRVDSLDDDPRSHVALLR